MPLVLDWGDVDIGKLATAARMAGFTLTAPRAGNQTGNRLSRAMYLSAEVTPEVLGAAVKASRDVAVAAAEQGGAHENTAADSQTKAIEAALARWSEQSSRLRRPPTTNLVGPKRALRRQFDHLVKWWKADTETCSSLTTMVNHPAYQGIIALGYPVIPLLLRELEQRPDYWFKALKMITGDDPVPISKRGQLKEMANVWLDWGRAHSVRW